MAKRKRGKAKTQNTWGGIFRLALSRGNDHGYAAHLADEWELRKTRARLTTNKRKP